MIKRVKLIGIVFTLVLLTLILSPISLAIDFEGMYCEEDIDCLELASSTGMEVYCNLETGYCAYDDIEGDADTTLADADITTPDTSGIDTTTPETTNTDSLQLLLTSVQNQINFLESTTNNLQLQLNTLNSNLQAINNKLDQMNQVKTEVNSVAVGLAGVQVSLNKTSTELVTLQDDLDKRFSRNKVLVAIFIVLLAIGVGLGVMYYLNRSGGKTVGVNGNLGGESNQQVSPQIANYITKQLTAGKKYYIEAIHREGAEGDNLAVGWQLPNGTMERPIPGIRLSPYSNSNPPAAPVVTITSPTNNSSYPSPSNITINATATSNGGSISKVEFYKGTTKIGEDLTAPYSFTWVNVTSGNYVLKAIATNNTGQTGTSPGVNIAVTTCPTPVITPLGPTKMCSGSVTLQSNTGSGYIYQWKKDGVNITDATNSYYTAFASGDYQVKIIQGSCISWSAPATVKIQSGLRASITPGGSTTFCTGGNVKLFANTCSDYTYQWKKDGLSISGATGATYTATIEGNYQLQVTQAGLNAWSALVTVTVNACRESDGNSNAELNALAAISEITGLSPIFQMQVFPNPNTGLFTILFNMPLTKEEKVKMRIVNLLGQEVYNKEYVTKDNYIKEVVELDKSFPSGIYKLEVMVGNKVENTSVVLSR